MKGALLGLAPALPVSIRLAWNGLPVKNALADYHILSSIVRTFFKKEIMMKFVLHTILGRYLRKGLRLTW
jgi:hypothetical protein